MLDLSLIFISSPIWGLLLLCSCGVCYIVQGRPIFFRQTRIGKDEVPFELIKIRTMKPDHKDACDEERVTRWGAFLRRSSIDELPEFWNVIKGDMSLVGPRPLLPEYLELYTPTQRRRHEVLPGITGLAQIKGRNQLSWNEKFAYDIKYVETKSMWLDMKIMMITFWVGLCGIGIGSSEKGTVGKRFEG